MDIFRTFQWICVILVVIFTGKGAQQVTGRACRPTDGCPPDLYSFNSSDFQNLTECSYPTTTPKQETTSASVIKTTTSILVSFNYNSTGPELICVQTCPLGYYGYEDETKKCVLCDFLCEKCTGSGNSADVCECKYGNNTAGICNEKPRDDTKGGVNDAIIIGAGVGGGVVLVIVIIVVVVVVVVIRRRKKNDGKSRMSMLIENRDDSVDSSVHIVGETSGQRGQRKIPTLQRQNYENTGKFDDSKVAIQAQINQDKIFRYVKDPVTGKEVAVKPKQRESGIYANASAVMLNQNLQGGDGEEIEISMLPVAPHPPGSSKKIKSFFKKFSSRRKTQQKKNVDEGISNQACAVPDEQENYEDMSGTQAPAEPEQPNYTAFDPTEEEPQENYANYEQNHDDMPQEDYENFGARQSTLNKGTKEESDEEQEDYENVQKVLDENEQEDYENFTGPPPPPANMMFLNGEDPTEDYENLNEDNPYMNIQVGKK